MSEQPEVLKRLEEAYEAWNRANRDPRYAGKSTEIEVNGKHLRVSF